MNWWKPKPTPEEVVLTQAAMRVRMEIDNLGSASPNEIDRAWARIIAESLEISGWRIERVKPEHTGHGDGNIADDCMRCAIEHPDAVAALQRERAHYARTVGNG